MFDRVRVISNYLSHIHADAVQVSYYHEQTSDCYSPRASLQQAEHCFEVVTVCTNAVHGATHFIHADVLHESYDQKQTKLVISFPCVLSCNKRVIALGSSLSANTLYMMPLYMAKNYVHTY